MAAHGSLSLLEKYIDGMSPYVKEKLVEAVSKSRGIPKINIEELKQKMKGYYEGKNFWKFREFIDDFFGKDFDKVVSSDEAIAKKILDLDLWFIIHYRLKTRMNGKFTGRLLEIVVESVLKSYLNTDLSYEFVDYDPVDYVIIRGNDIVCEISCKTFLSKDKRYNYEDHAKMVAEHLKEQNKKFVVFCGCANKDEKDQIRQRFQSINNCRLFYLWQQAGKEWKSSLYMLDNSFYEFIDFIKTLKP